MPVDLNQLPIPNWGLRCPRCQYLLRGLPSHRCPECGLGLNMAEIVSPWTRLRDPRFTGGELPFPDFGLTCETCNHPLAGAPRNACLECGAPFDPSAMRPSSTWFPVEHRLLECLQLPMVETILRDEQLPHVVHQTHNALGYSGWRLLVPSEFFFELLWVLARARRELGPEQTAKTDDDWVCPNCHECNPAGFDICWSCEPAR